MPDPVPLRGLPERDDAPQAKLQEMQFQLPPRSKRCLNSPQIKQRGLQQAIFMLYYPHLDAFASLNEGFGLVGPTSSISQVSPCLPIAEPKQDMSLSLLLPPIQLLYLQFLLLHGRPLTLPSLTGCYFIKSS